MVSLKARLYFRHRQAQARRRRALRALTDRRFWRAAALALPILGLVIVAISFLPASPLAPPGAVIGPVRVIDGDTFELLGGERVRILNIDTAEMPPRSRCAREEELALAAKQRLGALLRGGELTLHQGYEDRDVYGRLLRRVEVEGVDVGDTLIAEGLAQPWRGHRATWC